MSNTQENDSNDVIVSGMVGLRVLEDRHVQELGIRNHRTPGKDMSEWRYDGDKRCIFPLILVLRDSNETPKAPRPVDFSILISELGSLVRKVEIGTCTSTNIRRIYKLSLDFPVERDITNMKECTILWDRWGTPLIEAILVRLGMDASDLHVQENCLLLIKQLFKCQPSYADGLEPQIMQLLFECRSDGAAQVYLY